MADSSRMYMLAADEGKAIWFANALMIVKAGTEATGGRFSVIDQRVPGGYAVPRHVHAVDDEAWYIVEGDVTFYCGDQRFAASQGAWIFLPKGIPHTFKVGSSGARLLTLSAPSGFADFVEACGEPAPALALPPQGPLDIEKFVSVGATFGVEIVGPPPD